MSITINCDLGEGVGNDSLIIPFIHCANIACGYHAGDAATIKRTMEDCIRHSVSIGAHPSFYDRENFGRTEQALSSQEIYELITQQLYIFKEIADTLNVTVHHVKPHGALYNMSARQVSIARAIATAIKDFDSKLILFGLSESHSIKEAEAIGLSVAHEVFADRSYLDDRSLNPRTTENAVLNEHQAVQQVRQFLYESSVMTITGKRLALQADTVCIHGDNVHAVGIARAIHDVVLNNPVQP